MKKQKDVHIVSVSVHLFYFWVDADLIDTVSRLFYSFTLQSAYNKLFVRRQRQRKNAEAISSTSILLPFYFAFKSWRVSAGFFGFFLLIAFF